MICSSLWPWPFGVSFEPHGHQDGSLPPQPSKAMLTHSTMERQRCPIKQEYASGIIVTSNQAILTHLCSTYFHLQALHAMHALVDQTLVRLLGAHCHVRVSAKSCKHCMAQVGKGRNKVRSGAGQVLALGHHQAALSIRFSPCVAQLRLRRFIQLAKSSLALQRQTHCLSQPLLACSGKPGQHQGLQG